MSQQIWSEVDEYIERTLVPADDVLQAALAANAEAGLPPHDVSPAQGKLLELLARIQGARKILEIGTLGGYSTIWLARALPSDGQLFTLEIDPARAALARSNLARAGLDGVVTVRTGPALDSLRDLKADGAGPFDLVFIDADKPNNPHYLEWAIELSRRGSLIVADNVVRNGALADGATTDPNAIGVRQCLEQMASHPRLSATALQTVGKKGYDGFALALVLD